MAGNRNLTAKALSEKALMRMKAASSIRKSIRSAPNRTALAYNLGKDLIIALQYLPAAVLNRVQPLVNSDDIYYYYGRRRSVNNQAPVTSSSHLNYSSTKPPPDESKPTATAAGLETTNTSKKATVASTSPAVSSATAIFNSISSTFTYSSSTTVTTDSAKQSPPAPLTSEVKFDNIMPPLTGSPINQENVDIRTKYLISVLRKQIGVASSHQMATHLDKLFTHIYQHPQTIQAAIQNEIIKSLLKVLRQYEEDSFVLYRARELLAAVGHNPKVKGPGIKILSIDGGGVRGLVAIEVMRYIERVTQKKIHELFDYICGVSTGSILAFLLGTHHRSMDECEALYKQLSREVFNQNSIIGAGSLMWSQAYYHTPTWEKILKKHIGETPLLYSARDPTSPRVSAVSAVVNHERIVPYVFRTYSLPPDARARYLGGYHHDIWEAVRASAAAPTYFEEIKLGRYLHQDGGILVNNPTSVALSEAKSIWENVPLHCVLSLGTGLSFSSRGDSKLLSSAKGDESKIASSSSWKNKFLKVLDSATDTEAIHYTLSELLSKDVYFRFNPYLNEVVGLDEGNADKLSLIQAETREYLDRNYERIEYVGKILSKEKGMAKKVTDWWNY